MGESRDHSPLQIPCNPIQPVACYIERGASPNNYLCPERYNGVGLLCMTPR